MIIDEIDINEAKMNPTSFANAIKSGGDQGVLVGYEFEVCVPKKTYEIAKKMPKDYAAIVKNAFKHHVSFYGIPLDDVPVATFDKIFKLKPGVGADNSAQEVIQAYKKANTGKNDLPYNRKYTDYGDIMCAIFPGRRQVGRVEQAIDDYFDYDPEKVYKLLVKLYSEVKISDTSSYDASSDYPGYIPSANVVAQSVREAMGREVTIFTDYHQATKNMTDWFVEPDSSLDPDSEDSAV